MRLPEQLRIDPADDGCLRHRGTAEPGIVAEPQRVVGILSEVQVMRAKARVDHRELLGLGIVDCYLTRVLKEAFMRHVEGIELSRAKRRAPLTILWDIFR